MLMTGFFSFEQYLWRIGSQGLYAGYPHEVDRMWSGLPNNFTHIDAVYENKNRQIVFFIGKSDGKSEKWNWKNLTETIL